jgi:hypothetical protein
MAAEVEEAEIASQREVDDNRYMTRLLNLFFYERYAETAKCVSGGVVVSKTRMIQSGGPMVLQRRRSIRILD